MSERKDLFTAIALDRFLEQRREVIETARRLAQPGDVIIDPEDEVICDICNADVLEDPVWFNSYGVYCALCRRRRMKNERR